VVGGGARRRNGEPLAAAAASAGDRGPAADATPGADGATTAAGGGGGGGVRSRPTSKPDAAPPATTVVASGDARAGGRIAEARIAAPDPRTDDGMRRRTTEAEAKRGSLNNRDDDDDDALGLQMMSKLRADVCASESRLRELDERYARSVDESARARRDAEAASRAHAEEMRGMEARLRNESRLVDELRSRITHMKIETASSPPSARLAAAHPKKTRQQDDGEHAQEEIMKRLKDAHAREAALHDARVAELKSQIADATAECARMARTAQRAGEREAEERARARAVELDGAKKGATIGRIIGGRGDDNATDDGAPGAGIGGRAAARERWLGVAVVASSAPPAPVVDREKSPLGHEGATPPPAAAAERPEEVPVVAATGGTEENTIHDEIVPEWALPSASGCRAVGDNNGVVGGSVNNARRDGDNIDEDEKSLVVVHHHNKDEDAISSARSNNIGGRKMGWLRKFAMSTGLCDGVGMVDEVSLSSTMASVQSDRRGGSSRWRQPWGQQHRQRSETEEFFDDTASGVVDDASGTDDDASGTTDDDDDASAADDDGTCENSECSSSNDIINSFDSRIEFQELGLSTSDSSGTGTNKSQDIIGDAASPRQSDTASIRSSNEPEFESSTHASTADDSNKERSWFSASGWSNAINYQGQREGRDEIEERGGAESDPAYGRTVLVQ
jgi:hypothetical protein